VAANVAAQDSGKAQAGDAIAAPPVITIFAIAATRPDAAWTSHTASRKVREMELSVQAPPGCAP
jgi:hypothetical protein